MEHLLRSFLRASFVERADDTVIQILRLRFSLVILQITNFDSSVFCLLNPIRNLIGSVRRIK